MNKIWKLALISLIFGWLGLFLIIFEIIKIFTLPLLLILLVLFLIPILVGIHDLAKYWRKKK